MTACTRRCRAAIGNAKRAAHCTQCHATFTSVGAFDAHQLTRPGGRGAWCRPPSEVGLELRANGRWGSAAPAERPAHWKSSA